MSKLDDAKNLVTYCTKYPLHFKGSPIHIQYSKRQELIRDNSKPANVHANEQIDKAIAFLWTELTHVERSCLGFSVIMATVENMVYPLDLDILTEIFSKYGRVLKIRMHLNHTESFKAFIQMENPLVARMAVQNTNEHNIYDDSNFLKSKVYKMSDLVINPNEPNAIDYTRETHFNNSYQMKSSINDSFRSNGSIYQRSNNDDSRNYS
ncbi:MAG: Polypyrimidine tract binding protein 3, partial [Paramarteilia canceri]